LCGLVVRSRLDGGSSRRAVRAARPTRRGKPPSHHATSRHRADRGRPRAVFGDYLSRAVARTGSPVTVSVRGFVVSRTKRTAPRSNGALNDMTVKALSPTQATFAPDVACEAHAEAGTTGQRVSDERRPAQACASRFIRARVPAIRSVTSANGARAGPRAPDAVGCGK